MPTTHHEVIGAKIAAAHAEALARLGPVPDPVTRLHQVSGVNLVRGQQVVDTVTGQIGVIRGAGQKHVSRARARS